MIARYGEWLPVADTDPVITLGEGSTPLVQAEVLSERLGCEVWIKVEGANPTGSFKDRGMTVAVSVSAGSRRAGGGLRLDRQHLGLGRGVRRPRPGCCRSCCCRPAGSPPASSPRRSCTARKVVQIEGNFDDCLGLARKLADDYPVALVNSVNPIRIEGQKTAAFEIVDDLGDAPDLHVLPVGNGGNISAYWRGYTQYA